MGYLEKNFLLHERDAKGDILPIDIEATAFGGTIRVLPITSGELKSIRSKVMHTRGQYQTIKEKGINLDWEAELALKVQEMWNEMVVDHIIEPKLERQDLDNAKLLVIDGIRREAADYLLDLILQASGIEVKTNVTPEDAIKNTDKEIKN